LEKSTENSVRKKKNKLFQTLKWGPSEGINNTTNRLNTTDDRSRVPTASSIRRKQ
jgi:hypothetical protein